MKEQSVNPGWCFHTVMTLVLCWCCTNAEFLLTGQERFDETLLDRVIRGVEKATAFFKEDYASVNVDGLFGIRLCQGSITQSLEDCSQPQFRCPPDLIKRLHKITDMINDIAEFALPYVQQQDPVYYQRFLQTIDAPYIIHYVPQKLGDFVFHQGFDRRYDEEEGDRCYSEMLGTYSDEHRTYPKCTVTDTCWKLMSQPETTEYVITHQLLYLILVEKIGCLGALDKFFRKDNITSMREIQKQLCRQIYGEARLEENNGHVDVLQQDLFMEQIVLCGVLGFEEFFSRNWINLILSWQTHSGCFTMPDGLFTIEKEYSKIKERQRTLMKLLDQEAKQIDNAGGVLIGRTLMREKTMRGKCLAHKTGLGFANLGTFVRFLIYRLYSQQQPSTP